MDNSGILIKCFLSADINRQAQGRVLSYRKGILGHSAVSRDVHMTVLPPFRATYEQASEINVGCSFASIKSDHPMNTTIFEMKGLEMLEFDGEEFIVFPVIAHSSGERWEEYVLRTRQRLTDMGLSYAEPIPAEYRPHITVCRRDQIHKRMQIKNVIEESHKERPLHFNVTYLTLCTKYKEGYRMISHNPARD